jgi:hypothetical protein
MQATQCNWRVGHLVARLAPSLGTCRCSNAFMPESQNRFALQHPSVYSPYLLDLPHLGSETAIS